MAILTESCHCQFIRSDCQFIRSSTLAVLLAKNMDEEGLQRAIPSDVTREAPLMPGKLCRLMVGCSRPGCAMRRGAIGAVEGRTGGPSEGFAVPTGTECMPVADSRPA